MTHKVKALVVGAGLGGLAMGVKLHQAGVGDFVILEAEGRLGGTWRDNTYPGCACDVPVALYQFSFAPSLSWSHVYPRHDEIQAYCEWIADAFDLRSRLRLGVGAAHARWDGQAAVWRVTTTTGESYEAQVLIPALGQLNRPQLPAIAGRERFAGPAFHSARWRHDVALAGKRVGVIGSAASAVQLVPEVARQAGRLTVFQRSPNWLLPRNDRAISEEEKALILTAPHIAMMGRRQIYETAEALFWQAFSFTEVGRAAYARLSREHLEKQVADPALRARLTPDYPIGCKRVLFCDDYYPALQQPNVALVTDPITAIAPGGVETADGTLHPLDVLIYATGFETTDWRWSMAVEGAGGRTLAQAWAGGPHAYLGLMTAGFPNMFILYGPHTNLGHNSITDMLERQADYVIRALAALGEAGAAAMDVTPQAQARFLADLQERLSHTVWADPRCASWYKTAAGVITQNWGGTNEDYGRATAQVRLEDVTLIPAAG